MEPGEFQLLARLSELDVVRFAAAYLSDTNEFCSIAYETLS